MITFLSSPKAFWGVASESQLNAIRSWQSVHPDVEVILYGNSPGTKDAAESVGTKHVSAIECSPSGVPYFDAIANHARDHATFDVQVYLNCDILLTSRVLDAIAAVRFPRYLIVGQRIDLWDKAKAKPQAPGWVNDAEALARDVRATLHAPSGMDYFIFTRGMWDGIQPLTIGRAGYDTALINFCLKRDIPVVDATYMIPALHQFHDYSHVVGEEREVTAGFDAENNKRIHGVAHSAPNIADATWDLHDGQLVRNRSRGDWLRNWENFLRYRWRLTVPSYAIRALWRVVTAAGLHGPAPLELQDVLDSQFPKR